MKDNETDERENYLIHFVAIQQNADSDKLAANYVNRMQWKLSAGRILFAMMYYTFRVKYSFRILPLIQVK